MGRKKSTQSTTPRVPIKRKPKSQVRINKDIGKQFETEMCQYLTDYLNKRNITGIVYRYPEAEYNQVIDVILDSTAFGFCGTECKSRKSSTDDNGKIYFSQISGISKRNGLHQFVNEHRFLLAGTRFGMFAFKFRDINKVYIIPHQYMYEKYMNGEKYITVDEITSIGFDIEDEKASLKLYIKNKCRTVDT